MEQDVSARVEALKKRAAAAQYAHDQARQGHAIALDRRDQAAKAMQEEFGVSTREEAEVLLVTLEKDAEEKAGLAEALLGEAEAE